MEVILLKDIDKLGKEGSVIKVKDGYGRNYLIPEGLALKSEKSSYKKLEELKRAKLKTQQRLKGRFLEIKEKLEAISLTITAEVKENDDIYGSISEGQILKLLDEEGIKLERGSLVLEEPIRKLGVYNIAIKLCPDVEANLRIWIVKK
ncbi:MAG: 50S ribosomal protein L9 [Candidatus Omnitrophota bacterium]|nr:MAG: 50S ribosomal protein L9 [Candidatus Omnitrophota bacterium]